MPSGPAPPPRRRVTQLRPAARQLSPTLVDLKAIAPDLRGLFRDLGPLIRVSRRSLPALEGVLDDTRPLLGRIDPFLQQLNPLLDYIGLYRREIAAFFSLDAASTQATSPVGDKEVHYLRTTNPVNPEVLAAYPTRISSNRSNPYVEPGGYSKLRGGLEVFAPYLCGSGGSDPPLSPAVAATPLGSLVNQFVYGIPTNAGAAPPCRAQRPLGRLAGQAGVYPRLQPQP